MTEPDLILNHFSGPCLRVSLCALEMAELPYELRLVDLSKGEQSTAAYKKFFALGKVPALLLDGEPLLESSAIIVLVNSLRPEAGIFDTDRSPRGKAEAVGGLSFCGGTLHPQVRGSMNCQRITASSIEGVRKRSRELAVKAFSYVGARLDRRGWWLGDLSIVDVYLDRAFGVAARGAFDIDAFPTLKVLSGRLKRLLGYRDMMAVERRSSEALGL